MNQSLINFDPFSKVGLPRRFADVDDFFRGFQLAPIFKEVDADLRIKIDVSETDQAYSVKAEIPGLKKEDIKVDIDGNQVAITAEKKRQIDDKEGATILRSESYYGQIYRNFTLASDIDEENVIAKYQDGILDLKLPKKPGKIGKNIVVT